MSVQVQAAAPVPSAYDAVLNYTGLVPKDRSIITKCVDGYAPRQTKCEKAQRIVYLIWNAIKHIFGCSDWQNAQKVISDNFLQVAMLVNNNLLARNEVPVEARQYLLAAPILAQNMGAMPSAYSSKVIEALIFLRQSPWNENQLAAGCNVIMESAIKLAPVVFQIIAASSQGSDPIAIINRVNIGFANQS